MQILEYIVVPVISLAVLFGITKMMGYRQVSQLNMYDYKWNYNWEYCQ